MRRTRGAAEAALEAGVLLGAEGAGQKRRPVGGQRVLPSPGRRRPRRGAPARLLVERNGPARGPPWRAIAREYDEAVRWAELAIQSNPRAPIRRANRDRLLCPGPATCRRRRRSGPCSTASPPISCQLVPRREPGVHAAGEYGAPAGWPASSRRRDHLTAAHRVTGETHRRCVKVRFTSMDITGLANRKGRLSTQSSQSASGIICQI